MHLNPGFPSLSRALRELPTSPLSSWMLSLLFSCSVVSDSSVTLWTVAHQAPLSMGFSKQEYGGGLPFPSPGDLAGPGIKPASLVDSLPLVPAGKPSDMEPLTKEVELCNVTASSTVIRPLLVS